MRIEDTLDLTESISGSYAEHVGDKFLSVRDKKIGDLRELLHKQSIIIDRGNSEKEISYKIFEEEKKSSILFTMPDDFVGVEVTKYFLNNSNSTLSIEIGDYHKREGGPNDLVGGSYCVTGGIKCNIVFDGPDHLDGIGDVKKIKKILSDFYSK